MAILLLLGATGCSMQQGSPADSSGMRTLYEEQCRKGSGFACQQAQIRRGDAPFIPADAPATDLPIGRIGLQQAVQIGLNEKASLPFQLAPLAAENTMPVEIYESLRRFQVISDSDIIGRTAEAGPDGRALPVVLVRVLQAGTRRLTDVPFSVTGPAGRPALGAPFFARFTAWSISQPRHVLHLE